LPATLEEHESLRVAVVTGGSSGIGAAVARALSDRGYRCVLLARGRERLEALADALGAEFEVCDVGDRSSVGRAAAAVQARHGAVRVLVNSAGIPGRAGFLDADPERIEEVTRINYLGGVWCVRAFLPALEAAAPSHVVNVVSVAGTVAVGTSGLYTAAKHAQLAFSRSLAAEIAPRGVRVHSVLPGFVETEGFPQYSVHPRWMHPFIASPEDVARAVVRAVERNRAEVTVPRYYRLGTIAQWLLPGLVARAGRSSRIRRPA
jgi:short-subunit dehydrogenase